MGPVLGGCTTVNDAGAPVTASDYVETVAQAFGVPPVWGEDLPAWTGQIMLNRARGWAWTHAMTLSQALAERTEGHGGGRAGAFDPKCG